MEIQSGMEREKGTARTAGIGIREMVDKILPCRITAISEGFNLNPYTENLLNLTYIVCYLFC
jgi:hypothetical protein